MAFIILLVVSIIALPLSLLLGSYARKQNARAYWIRSERYEELTGKPYN